MAGSPSTVKYRAGRSGVALANTIWWASVVFPHPGAPAMMLNEYSGRPPPRISSRPGTPVGSFRMVTLSSALIILPRLPASIPAMDASRPGVTHEAQREGFADEGHQQSEQLGHDNDSRLTARSRVLIVPGPVESFQRAVGPHLHGDEQRDFGLRHRQRPRQEGAKAGDANQLRERQRNFSHTRTASLPPATGGSSRTASRATNRRARSRVPGDAVLIVCVPYALLRLHHGGALVRSVTSAARRRFAGLITRTPVGYSATA